ncbi:MAG: CpcT/CpeT family chromophore lyase, partial [Cyanobacteriota bacterium]|nr:CpcT/CpeT family chromophore lyase [Cyanobacteriota bacterium]
MSFSPELIALARYLAGEFDNIAQASAEPVWYVPLYLWHRPLPIQ